MPARAPSWASARVKPMSPALARSSSTWPAWPFWPLTGTDGDHAAELALAHAGPDRVGHVEDAREVGVDDLFPLLRGHLVEHAVAGDAGVVDEDLDRAELGLDLGHARLAGVVIGHRPFEGLDAGLVGEFPRRVVVAGVVRRDIAARLLERHRDRRADPPRPARHKCRPCHVSPPLQCRLERCRPGSGRRLPACFSSPPVMRSTLTAYCRASFRQRKPEAPSEFRVERSPPAAQ